MDIQPIDRAIPTTDGRWNIGHSKRRASGHHRPVPCPSTRSKLNQPAMAGVSRSIARGPTTRAPIPSGPSSHFWAGIA